MEIIQSILNEKKGFTKAWQLNERHYGALTGLSKVEMIRKLGEKKYMNLEDPGILDLNH